MMIAPFLLLLTAALAGPPLCPQDTGESKRPNRLVHNPLVKLRETPPEEVAFWVHLDGLTHADGSPVEAVPVPLAEWEEYLANVRRIYGAVLPMDTLLVTSVVRQFIEQRVALMSHESELPAMLEKCNEISRKIRREVDFIRLVHQYTNDRTLKQVDGRAGIHSHSMLRYPLDMELFKLEDGEIAGPFWTMYGAEFFQVMELVGERGTLQEGTSVRQISLYFDTQDESQRRRSSRIRQFLRLRTDREEFKRVLPPALQLDPPRHFGPTEVAPMGEPGKPLDIDHRPGIDKKDG